MSADILPASERALLLGLQQPALRYFLDNQRPNGLVLDRQANHEPLYTSGWSSTAATGMGLIAVALASAEPYRLIEPAEAVGRVRAALDEALWRMPNDHGILPHFLDADGVSCGADAFSTVDSSWLVAGGLWAAAFLHNAELHSLADQLYRRVDWKYWARSDGPRRGLLRHGKNQRGRFLPHCWDRLNGETVFMYVLGAGAAEGKALPQESGMALRPFYGTVAGLRFNNADLGLFAFEYGLDLLDLAGRVAPDGGDLAAEARLAVRANCLFCREQADKFATYRRFWGLSDGDCPGDRPGTHNYRAAGPGAALDGTAHLTAVLAAVAHAPAPALECLARADGDAGLGARGRYGLSSVNLDRQWVARDMVGIDAGAAVLALDNYLMENRVRRVFHTLPCVGRGLERLGFRAS